MGSTLDAFDAQSDGEKLGQLVAGAARSGHATHYNDQLLSWQAQMPMLSAAFRELKSVRPDSRAWTVLLEYEIPRRQRRIDAVVLAGPAVVPIEFKVGANTLVRSDLWQAEDYALDLRDFHEASRNRYIAPVLVATEWPPPPVTRQGSDFAVLCTGSKELAMTIANAVPTQSSETAIDPHAWDAAGFAPTPSIVEATQLLFSAHSVADLSHHYADNLSETVNAIVREVERARQRGERLVCFVTGVPGAGKTLTGLEAVHRIQAASAQPGIASFLSGNGPLVKILREAIARDAVQQARKAGIELRKEVANRTAVNLIQNVHQFVTEYGVKHRDLIPKDRVVIYDEAQRAWHAEQVAKFHKQELGSEPSLMLDTMSRTPDWGVVIAVVGGGQEINTGEAGLEEWGRAIAASPHRWRVVASSSVLSGDEATGGHRLFTSAAPANADVVPTDALHLRVSVRSPRAKYLAQWVDAVLAMDAPAAREAMSKVHGFRMGLTRNLEAARAWLRDASRGERRPGLLASSGAARLRAYGLEIDSAFHRGFPYVNWFLDGPSDVRSSHQLEVALTEFECQGLELDYVGLCWGDDFTVAADGTWDIRRFLGSRWTRVRTDSMRQFMVNKYRVLLTRAREGLLIWVPPGDLDDPTREPARLDRTASFLVECGLELIEQGPDRAL
ncbi:MAG: DNA/RNA helicase domain-containing protein [Phycisphaerales bacterium]